MSHLYNNDYIYKMHIAIVHNMYIDLCIVYDIFFMQRKSLNKMFCPLVQSSSYNVNNILMKDQS